MKKFLTLAFLLSLVVNIQACKKQDELFDDSKNQAITKITMPCWAEPANPPQCMYSCSMHEIKFVTAEELKLKIK